jgi:transcription elongation factor Elf1
MKICTICRESKPLSDFHKKGEKNYQSQCKSCDLVNKRIHYHNNKELYSARNRKAKRGITEQQYLAMRLAQDYECAICGTDEDDLTKGLGVDHNHDTNIIRGLLCASCNAGVGMFKDNIDLLKSAIKYLEEYKGE